MGHFLDYKMVDSKTVVNQVQEVQAILHKIHVKGMMLSKTFQVAVIIEKLPSAWKNFKNYLKHKRKVMRNEDMIIRLCIEEDNGGSEKKGAHNPGEAKANFVEHQQNYKFKKATKRKAVRWDLKGEYLRSRSSKGNASTVGSKEKNLQIEDCQR